MKRVSIIILFVIAIISYQNVIFASYSSEALEEELHQQVDQVFKERTRIWNQLLMGQYLSIDEVKMDLKKIAVNPLLKSDLEMFQQMLDNPTSYEVISDVTIKDIYIVKANLNKVELIAIISWNVLGYESEYTEEIEYMVQLEKIEDNWLLANYEISR